MRNITDTTLDCWTDREMMEDVEEDEEHVYGEESKAKERPDYAYEPPPPKAKERPALQRQRPSGSIR
jgi:hypothetical protein